jgi:outer membrane protein insertion porin family
LPLPFLKDIDTARVSWFVDTGSAYKNIHTFSAKQLRASTGLSLQWQSPIGPLVINLAFPFRSQPGDSHYKERVQFTFGSQF